MIDAIIIVILIAIVTSICFYIVKEKKKGKKCIGCPYSDSCRKKDCGTFKND